MLVPPISSSSTYANEIAYVCRVYNCRHRFRARVLDIMLNPSIYNSLVGKGSAFTIGTSFLHSRLEIILRRDWRNSRTKLKPKIKLLNYFNL